TVALMEPGGRFVILNLADGRKVVDEKLHEESNVQRIYVIRSQQQDFLVTDRPPGPMGVRQSGPTATQFRFSGAIPPLMPPDAFTQPISGRVYAFDRTSGKPSWTEPASIEQQNLWLAQPRELPVLVFVSNLQSPVPNRQQAISGSILCLDKRTGRLAYENDKLPQL